MQFRRMFFIILFLFSILITPVLAEDESEIVNLCGSGNKVIQLEAKTYMIGNSFELPSNIELIGKDGTCFMLKEECGIPQNVPMISIKNQKNITIRNVRFEGQQEKQTYSLKYSNPNHPEQSGKKKYGNQVNTFIYAINCENITVTECEGNDNLGDFLRCSGCKNVEFSYNSARMGGHDVFFALRSTGIRVHHNRIKTLVNAAVRLLDVSHARVYNNIISWEGPRDAGPAIQIQHDKGTMEDIEVCGNKIYSSCGPGLWLVGKTSGGEDLWLHHNLFMNCGDNRISWVGGIIASGYDNARIENNVFDGCYRGGVVFFAVNSAWATNADAEISKNIFTNGKASQLDGRGPYGIENTISKQDAELSQNSFYNNAGGNVIGCKLSDSDIFYNPKSTSTPSGWTWEGSEWSCPEVSPSAMNGIPGSFTPLSEEEIEEAEKSAQGFEFNDIFDVFNLNIVEQAGNNSIILPDGVDEPPQDAVATITQANSSTTVYVPSNGLTSVTYEVNGETATHITMIGEKVGNTVKYSKCSIWQGSLSHTSDSLYLVGHIDPEKIKITCTTPKGSFTPNKELEYTEVPNRLFNPLLFVVFLFLAPWICLGYFVLTRYFRFH